VPRIYTARYDRRKTTVKTRRLLNLPDGFPDCGNALSIPKVQGVRLLIRTIQPLDEPDPGLERVAKASGFSLHAGVSCEGHQKDKRERIFRYIARPPVAVPRLSLSSTGKVVYTLKARGSRRPTAMAQPRWY
jgi:hypothetical protein